MNAKKAKAARRLLKDAPELATTANPADDTRDFVCACGEKVPRPSFSVTKGLYITGRHGKEVWQWLPTVTKKGVPYIKMVRVGYEVCNALAPVNETSEEVAPEPQE